MTRPYQEETALPWWCSALTNKDLVRLASPRTGVASCQRLSPALFVALESAGRGDEAPARKWWGGPLLNPAP